MAARPIFSHLALAVADLETMTEFYCSSLDFERGGTYSAAGRRVSNLMDCAPDGFQGTFLRRGDFMLELLAYVDPVTPAQRPRLPNELGFAHISFLVDDAHKTLDRVVQCGGSAHTRLTQSFTTGSETVILFCLDPEGNRIELVSHVDADECDSHAGFLGLDSTGWPARAEFYASDH